jgi:hypothetical protein
VRKSFIHFSLSISEKASGKRRLRVNDCEKKNKKYNKISGLKEMEEMKKKMNLPER